MKEKILCGTVPPSEALKTSPDFNQKPCSEAIRERGIGTMGLFGSVWLGSSSAAIKDKHRPLFIFHLVTDLISRAWKKHSLGVTEAPFMSL